jgi:hypothetical protein
MEWDMLQMPLTRMEERSLSRRFIFRALQVAAALMGLAALYVLSFGPAIWLGGTHFGNTNGRFEKMEAFYRPLGWLADEAPAFKSALRWYALLWQVKHHVNSTPGDPTPGTQ